MRPRICVYRAADRAFRLDWNRYYEKQTIGGFAQLGRTVVSFQWRRPLTDAEKLRLLQHGLGSR